MRSSLHGADATLRVLRHSSANEPGRTLRALGISDRSGVGLRPSLPSGSSYSGDGGGRAMRTVGGREGRDLRRSLGRIRKACKLEWRNLERPQKSAGEPPGPGNLLDAAKA